MVGVLWRNRYDQVRVLTQHFLRCLNWRLVPQILADLGFLYPLRTPCWCHFHFLEHLSWYSVSWPSSVELCVFCTLIPLPFLVYFCLFYILPHLWLFNCLYIIWVFSLLWRFLESKNSVRIPWLVKNGRSSKWLWACSALTRSHRMKQSQDGEGS